LVPQNLWSIIGDSGYIVSSLLPSTAAWHSVHIPTGKMGTRPANASLAGLMDLPRLMGSPTG
jgi:hypothetical protein